MGMMEAFYDWIELEGAARKENFGRYFVGVAQARYVIRNILRIVDEQARAFDLEPLHHQALIQIFGATETLQVRDLALRLGVSPALGSRLVRELEQKALVQRATAEHDRRATLVTATESGIATLREIDEQVHVHVEYFQHQLSEEERAAALMVFAFYVGASPDLKELTHQREAVVQAAQPKKRKAKAAKTRAAGAR